MGNQIARQLGNPSGILSSVLSVFFKYNNNANTRWMIEQLQVQKGQSILVIGFGTGADVDLFANLVGDKGCVYGIERSEDMLKIATANNQKHIDNGIVKLMLGDCTNMDTTNLPKFDIIFHFNVIYFWENPAQVLERLSGLLAENGIIASGVSIQTRMMSWIIQNFQRKQLDSLDDLIEYGEKAQLQHVSSQLNGSSVLVVHSNSIQ
jgi:ubiquinone/menaquinone biosynthesis C-methylase UbiE